MSDEKEEKPNIYDKIRQEVKAKQKSEAERAKELDESFFGDSRALDERFNKSDNLLIRTRK